MLTTPLWGWTGRKDVRRAGRGLEPACPDAVSDERALVCGQPQSSLLLFPSCRTKGAGSSGPRQRQQARLSASGCSTWTG